MSEPQKYVCSVDSCNFTTEHKRGLSVHQTTIHDGGVTYVDGNCENCGSFVSRPESKVSDTGNMFCDHNCYTSWNTGNNHSNHKQKIKKHCKNCGELFEVHEYRADDAKFCSDKCFGEHKTTESTLTISCDWCDTEYREQNYKIKREEHHFCSKACYGSWQSVNRTGQNHPNWTGGANLYEAIRENLSDKSWSNIAELNRSDECYKCGESNTTLHEHHIIPVMFGGCNDSELLMTVCESCHRTIESYTMRKLNTNIMEMV